MQINIIKNFFLRDKFLLILFLLSFIMWFTPWDMISVQGFATIFTISLCKKIFQTYNKYFLFGLYVTTLLSILLLAFGSFFGFGSYDDISFMSSTFAVWYIVLVFILETLILIYAALYFLLKAISHLIRRSKH